MNNDDRIFTDLKNKRFILLLTCLVCFALAGRAWDFWPLPMAEPDTARDEICYGFDVAAVASSGTDAPFFFHANQSGHISTAPYSGSIAAWIGKNATRPNRWWDYDFRVDLAGRFDTEKQTGYFRQLYAHVRLYVFDFTAGIYPTRYGCQDKDLTTGGFLFSGNAQPLPRISIGIDRYTAFPGLYGYVEVKGGLTHGWFADNSALDLSVATTNTLLHHKYAGLRLGGKLPVNIAYEIHHAAQWGGTSPFDGEFSTNWQAYKNIFFVRSGGSTLSDQLNAEGNHIGFQELSVQVKQSWWRMNLYWQTIFEDRSASFIGTGNSRSDGLWGVHFEQTKWRYISGFSYEYLNTTTQDGPYHDKDGIVYAGRDSYFYNSSYRQGWTHFGRTIGNPLLSPQNNRVRTHFAGVKGDIYGFRYRLMAAYTRNWGTYQAPKPLTDNTALLLEVKKQVPKAWGMEFGISLGANIGSQYGNSFGAMLTISKRGLLISYK